MPERIDSAIPRVPKFISHHAVYLIATALGGDPTPPMR